MKSKIFTFICLLAIGLCSTSACASKKLLPKLKKQPGISSVYVGKALLNMSGASGGMGLPGVDVDVMGKNLDSIDIISAETASAAKYLRSITADAIDKLDGVELAMERQDDDTSTQIYVVPSSDGSHYTRLILLVNDIDEYTIIDMQGTLPLDALNSY